MSNLNYRFGYKASTLVVNSLSNAELALNYAPFLANNTNQFNVYWYCEWSSCPIFTGTDIFAISWVACTSSSTPISMRYRQIPSCTVQYYSTADAYAYLETISGVSEIGHAYFNVEMHRQLGNIPLYAKMTAGNIQLITQSDSYNLYTIQFLASYGHSTLTLFPSVSFSTSGISLGISYAWTMENLHPTNHTYYNGNIIN